MSVNIFFTLLLKNINIETKFTAKADSKRVKTFKKPLKIGKKVADV